MNKIERVLTALNCKKPDMVPFMFNTVSRSIQERILKKEVNVPTIDGMNITGWIGGLDESPAVEPGLTCSPELALRLGLDAIQIQILPPIFADTIVHNGNKSITKGLICNAQALSKVKMPDPDDEKLLRQIEKMIRQYKGDFAMGARVRIGASPSLLSMGMDNFSYMLVDEPETVHNVIKMYTEWSKRLFKNLSELDFDFFWCFDDIAFGKSLMFSTGTFREYFLPYMKESAKAIKHPFIFHSDGYLVDIMDDIIEELGASGLHPIEQGSMDHVWLKQTYGKRICLLGNLDIDGVLSKGTIEGVFEEVKERIEQLGPGGGYIISDSNSVPDYCLPENIEAAGRAVEKYRRIY
jgi:uroporphyrinogen-III decarboxylase